MVKRIIELSVRHKWVVFGAVLALALLAADSARKTPLDALPDISDPQVIVYTEWMGRSPDLVEDQITYPLVRALQGESIRGERIRVGGSSLTIEANAAPIRDAGGEVTAAVVVFWTSPSGSGASAPSASSSRTPRTSCRRRSPRS